MTSDLISAIRRCVVDQDKLEIQVALMENALYLLAEILFSVKSGKRHRDKPWRRAQLNIPTSELCSTDNARDFLSSVKNKCASAQQLALVVVVKPTPL